MINSKSSVRRIAILTLVLSAFCCMIISLGRASASPSSNLAAQQSSSAAQSPTPNVTCTATLSPTSDSYASNGTGGTGTFSVTIGPTCSWTAVSNDSWITITSGAGIGNGTVTYTVGANNSNSARSGTITVVDKTFTVVQGAFFADVPTNNVFYTFIGKLSARGVTTGCGLNGQNQRLYCPTSFVTRQEMAAFIIRSKGEFTPPTPNSQRFGDVPPENPFYNFIDRMAALMITNGCNTNVNPPLYCPSDNVTREQMAAFIIRGIGEFTPPTPGSQRFGDVPPSNVFYNFIDRMAALMITNGCNTNVNPPLYCPSDNVTREQMAAFLVRAFHL